MKVGNIKRRCPDGEVYRFKNGVAEVPGLRMAHPSPWMGTIHKTVKITIKEFDQLVKEIEEKRNDK